MQMRLACGLSVFDPLFQDVFCLFNELSVQVNGVAVDSADGIVLAEDEVGGLLVVLIHHGAVSFAFFGELVRGTAVSAFVGIVGLVLILVMRKTWC